MTEMTKAETTFAWCVKEIAKERGLAVEDLELPERSRRALENHMAGVDDRSVRELCRDVADALGVDYRNGDPDARDLAIAYCTFLFEASGRDPKESMIRS